MIVVWNLMALLFRECKFANGNFTQGVSIKASYTPGGLLLPLRPLTAIHLAWKGAFWLYFFNLKLNTFACLEFVSINYSHFTT